MANTLAKLGHPHMTNALAKLGHPHMTNGLIRQAKCTVIVETETYGSDQVQVDEYILPGFELSEDRPPVTIMGVAYGTFPGEKVFVLKSKGLYIHECRVKPVEDPRPNMSDPLIFGKSAR